MLSNNNQGSDMFLKSKKLRSLILRVCLWEIKSTVFSSQGCLIRSYEDNMILAKEIMSRIAPLSENTSELLNNLFPYELYYNCLSNPSDINDTSNENEDNEIYIWEDIISKTREFEKKGRSIQIYSAFSLIPAHTHEVDIENETLNQQLQGKIAIDCLKDFKEQSLQLRTQYRMSLDEQNFLDGLIQHETIQLLQRSRSTLKDRFEYVRSRIQLIEQMVLDTEQVSQNYFSVQQDFTKSMEIKSGTSGVEGTGIKSKVVQNFYNLLIDERRKIESLEDEISVFRSKLGPLSNKELYLCTEDVGSKKQKQKSTLTTETIESVINYYPFRAFDIEKKLDSNLSGPEAHKQRVIQRVEADKLSLTSENRRLRESISEKDHHLYIIESSDIKQVLSEISKSEIECDELDNQIKKMQLFKEALIQSLLKHQNLQFEKPSK